MIEEIVAQGMDVEGFIQAKVAEIRDAVGSGTAINALSGGVDSSTVTMLGHRALGDRLQTVFVQNGLMREGEAERVVELFRNLGVTVRVVDARKEFFGALKGLTDPEEKREAITREFYRNVLARAVRESGAKYLLQGTILTDVEETVAGIKRQHNMLAQLGIDPQEAFGYRILEPLVQLRKDGVRKVGKGLGLPDELFQRMPVPRAGAFGARDRRGDAGAGRDGPEGDGGSWKTMLKDAGAFQYMAILHADRVTGMRDGRRDYGQQIEVRCWDSVDARVASPTKLPFETLRELGRRITEEVPGVVSVTYNIASKPPSTIEAV